MGNVQTFGQISDQNELFSYDFNKLKNGLLLILCI